jgi:transcriptional regulator with XRE-family HTH domain
MRVESIHTASLIRKKRRELDITQQELSRLIGWGEDKNGQFLSNLERGRAQLPPKHINITSKILEIDKMLLIEQMANDYKQSLIKITGNDEA